MVQIHTCVHKKKDRFLSSSSPETELSFGRVRGRPRKGKRGKKPFLCWSGREGVRLRGLGTQTGGQMMRSRVFHAALLLLLLLLFFVSREGRTDFMCSLWAMVSLITKHTHTYTYIHTYIHIHIYIHIHVYSIMDICWYVCIHSLYMYILYISSYSFTLDRMTL